MFKHWIGLVMMVMVAACAGEANEGSLDPSRGPLGKADLFGSCAAADGDYCGGPSDGTCWCDDLCETYGDCCEDKAATCDGAQACGGLAGLTCPEGQYCAYAADQMCGAADQMGTCTDRPDACIELFAPVCGCDGNTYSNSCHAAAAGVSVASEGACPAPAPVSCELLGGVCVSSSLDVTFPADCEAELGTETLEGACPALNQACCAIDDDPCGGCPEGRSCQLCWGSMACIPDGAMC